jgi:phthiocerol/phenolphthiocerol synthesis type-I polyketide synthase D
MAAVPPQFSVMFFAASAETLDGEKYRLVLDAARFTDEHAFSSVWIPERHFATLGGLYPNPSVLHAALATITQRVNLRAGSVVLPLHDPLRVAEEWSLVDNLSNGRVGLSFASGWNPDDFVLSPDRYDDRSEELFRAIPVVRELWRGGRIVRTNGVGRKVEIGIQPRPVQSELPTWVTAARAPGTFVRAGAMGANLLSHLLDQDVDELARKIKLYRDARARSGHDPDSGIVTIMLHTFVGEDVDEVREQGRKPYCDFLKSNAGLLKALATSRDHAVDLDALSPEAQDEFVNFLYDRFASTRALIGTPESCLDLAGRLGAIGVNEIACLLDFGPPYDLVLHNLVHLDRLRALCATEAFNRSVPSPRANGSRPTSAAEPVHVGACGQGTREALDEVRARCGDVLSGADFYARLRAAG